MQTVQRWVPPHGTIQTLMVTDKMVRTETTWGFFGHTPINALKLYTRAAVHFFTFFHQTTNTGILNTGNSVGPYVLSCQMFVKSEFPLDSALVCDSDQKKLGWHFFRKL